ncbi:hypothetical protein ACLB2K_068450 [Fragaria x ananassa]
MENRSNSREGGNRPKKCFKCSGLGHIASECPNRRVVNLVEEIGETSDAKQVISAHTTVLWMAIGDFNYVLGAHEKSGGPPPSLISCLEFQNMLDACDFVHLDTADITAHVVGFYQNLYSSSSTPRNLDEVCSVIPSLVTNTENDWLIVIPSTEEIKNAVFAMDASSAPGPDGFPGCFYQSYWDIVDLDVVACVRQFFMQNWLLPNINCNFLVLLPKVQDAHENTQFRPIALANFLFKIILKILASRLGPIAARIISPEQGAFIPSRRITSCIGTVFECFNLLVTRPTMGRLLSMAGQTQLVQSVFQSMLLHSFSVYQWPVYLVKKLTSWARNFIWSGNIGTRKIVTIHWAQVCAPKLEGGLGIHDLSSLNSAAILKFAWDFFSSHSQWGDYVRSSAFTSGGLNSIGVDAVDDNINNDRDSSAIVNDLSHKSNLNPLPIHGVGVEEE